MRATKKTSRASSGVMSSASRWLLVLAISGSLAGSTIACPLWISLHGKGSASGNCHQQNSQSEQCPAWVCQADTPYLASQADIQTAPFVKALPGEGTDAALLVTGPVNANVATVSDIPPPVLGGSVLLRIHVLLI